MVFRAYNMRTRGMLKKRARNIFLKILQDSEKRKKNFHHKGL